MVPNKISIIVKLQKQTEMSQISEKFMGDFTFFIVFNIPIHY